jgi:hypothetical protein
MPAALWRRRARGVLFRFRLTAHRVNLVTPFVAITATCLCLALAAASCLHQIARHVWLLLPPVALASYSSKSIPTGSNTPTCKSRKHLTRAAPHRPCCRGPLSRAIPTSFSSSSKTHYPCAQPDIVCLRRHSFRDSVRKALSHHRRRHGTLHLGKADGEGHRCLSRMDGLGKVEASDVSVRCSAQ